MFQAIYFWGIARSLLRFRLESWRSRKVKNEIYET